MIIEYKDTKPWIDASLHEVFENNDTLYSQLCEQVLIDIYASMSIAMPAAFTDADKWLFVPVGYMITWQYSKDRVLTIEQRDMVATYKRYADDLIKKHMNKSGFTFSSVVTRS